jgi:hypothetical protein
MSWNGFNFNNNQDECNCPECRGVSQVEQMYVDISIENPDDIINDFFDEIKEARSEDELFLLLAEFYDAVYKNTYKEFLIDELNEKINTLHVLEYPEFDDE